MRTPECKIFLLDAQLVPDIGPEWSCSSDPPSAFTLSPSLYEWFLFFQQKNLSWIFMDFRPGWAVLRVVGTTCTMMTWGPGIKGETMMRWGSSSLGGGGGEPSCWPSAACMYAACMAKRYVPRHVMYQYFSPDRQYCPSCLHCLLRIVSYEYGTALCCRLYLLGLPIRPSLPPSPRPA